MSILAPNDLVTQLRWRYATKQFDPAKPIPATLWDALEQALVLTPSSYGLQPWKFLVITDPAVKATLRPLSWNQAQVVECSHHVVFLARDTMTEADIDRLVQATASARGTPIESLAKFKAMLSGDVVTGARSKWVREWAERQVYIALGQFMAACAVLGVDACPMEGIDPAKYDDALGLAGTGYHTVVCCPAGYRLAGDKYASLNKVRFPRETVIERR